MTQHDISDAERDRARIDGGFSFALAAFLLGLGLLAVLDRVGLPDELLRLGLLGLVLAGLVVIALLLRTMRPAEFYAAGRRLPSSYAGLVLAGSGFALVLPFLPPLPQGIGFFSIAVGFGLGFVALAGVTGPALRASGSTSLVAAVAARFPLPAIRLPLVLVNGFCAASVMLGGYAIALQGLVAATGLEPQIAAACLAALLILLTVPAGLSGVVWTSAAAAVVTLAALALPLALGLAAGHPFAFPILGNDRLWAKSVSDLAVVTGSDLRSGIDLSVALAFGLGLATLAPDLGAAVASRDAAEARRGGLIGTAWLAVGGFFMAATLAGAALMLQADAAGHKIAALPSALLKASDAGRVTICGAHAEDAAAVAEACGGKASLGLHDIHAKGIDLLTSLPLLHGSEPTLARLASLIALVLGSGLAAAGVQSLAASLVEDLSPAQRRRRPASRRLALARAASIAAIVLAGLWLSVRAVDPALLFGLALVLSGALLSPLFVLMFVPAARWISAAAALLVAALVMAHGFLVHGTAPLAALTTDAVFAAVDGLAIGLFIALLPKRQAPEPQPAATAVAPGREATPPHKPD